MDEEQEVVDVVVVVRGMLELLLTLELTLELILTLELTLEFENTFPISRTKPSQVRVSL